MYLRLISSTIRFLSAAAPASPVIKLLFSIALLPRNGMTWRQICSIHALTRLTSDSLPYAMYFIAMGILDGSNASTTESIRSSFIPEMSVIPIIELAPNHDSPNSCAMKILPNASSRTLNRPSFPSTARPCPFISPMIRLAESGLWVPKNTVKANSGLGPLS